MYKFTDYVTSETGFIVEADTLEQLFKESAMAVTETGINLDTIKGKKEKIIKVESNSLDNLLFDWIGEIIYLKDTENLMLNSYEITIDKDKNKLEAKCKGDKIDRDNHDMKLDVKAITFKDFYVKREDGKWKCNVVLDV